MGRYPTLAETQHRADPNRPSDSKVVKQLAKASTNMQAIMDENERLRASNTALLNSLDKALTELKQTKARLQIVQAEHNQMAEKLKRHGRMEYSKMNRSQLTNAIKAQREKLARMEAAREKATK